MAINGTLSELSGRQQRAIMALLSAPTVKAAADDAGVGLRTLHRWMDDETFRQALREAEAEALATASRALLALASRAIYQIGAILWDATAPASVKLRAADVVIGRLIELRQQHDLEARIAALELEAQKEGQDAGGAIAASAPARTTIDYRHGV